MCDTFVAMSEATADESVILGKNSDREPNEAHEVVVVPAGQHDASESLPCTYITIDQVQVTRAVLLAKPYWIWGAEMGVNDAGVAIGNEAVFTKIPREKQPGLLGMDLLRLGLERAATADEAADVITTLLAAHGQEGQAGHTHNLKYDNSFIVADPSGALIVETMGRDWVIRNVKGSDSISNAITTRTDWDRSSPALESVEVDVAKQYSDFLYTTFSDASARQCRTFDTLAAKRGSITVSDAIELLRDHGESGDDPQWAPDRAVHGQTICAHAGFGPIRSAQSTGSMVVRLTPDGATIWVTGTSAPCTSVFKPVWIDSGIPDTGPVPGKWYDPKSLWWQHERLHRSILADYPSRIGLLSDERDELERRSLAEAATVDGRDDRRRFSERAFALAAELEAEWMAKVDSTPIHRGTLDKVMTAPYQQAWRSFDKAAKVP